MINAFSRTELLIGTEGVERLKRASVAVFGVGGVGSFTAEALARTGVSTFYLYDNDKVSLTNINRQIIATTKTIGRIKVDVMKERILEINPEAVVHANCIFLNAETIEAIDFSAFDYVVDAIDTISSKLLLVERCHALGIPIMSSMGAGNKLDPTRFEVADIYKTSMCPLAKVMRKELKARHIKHLKVVYSKEEALKPKDTGVVETTLNQKRQLPGSIAFVPSVAGLIIAGEVIKDLISQTSDM